MSNEIQVATVDYSLLLIVLQKRCPKLIAVPCVFEDKRGDFWVATDDGYLNLLDKDSGEELQRFLNPSALITTWVLTAILHQLGHKVDTVADGSAAISTYSEALSSGKKDDIVILDLTIPGGMGGGEVIKLLHQLDPGKNCGFQRILQ